MCRTIGVLVHGAGWVSTQHIAALQRNPYTEVVAICSRSLEGAQRRARAHGLGDIAVYDDLGRALQQPGVDAVAICTPQHLHGDNIVQAAAAGKHLIIEKPIAISLDELRRIRNAVQAAGVKTVVSFVLRWNPLFRLLKSLIHEGAIGRPYYVEADYLSNNGSWWSGWNAARTAEHGVSALLVGGCHAVDALRWFAASGEYEAARPVEVFAMSGGRRKGTRREYNPLHNTWLDEAPPMEYDGVEAVLVRFDNGVFGKVTVNAECIMPYRFPVRIFGDRGTVFDNRIWSHKFPGQTDWITLPSIQPESSNVQHHPFQAEIDHFVDCVRQGIESHCNVQDALRTHEIVFAAQRCYQTGQPVAFPLI